MGSSGGNGASKVVTLPNKEEIMRRMGRVDIGTGTFIQNQLYPLLAQAGDQVLTAQGVIMMIEGKILKFEESFGVSYSSKTELLRRNVPKIIDALVDEKEVAREAKRLHQKAMGTRGFRVARLPNAIHH